MAPSQSSEATLLATRRTRKSIADFSLNKENATMDFSEQTMAPEAAANKRKLRSKSMGPGGLDALKSASGNRRVSLAAPIRPLPRSILKPTMPLLPDIPPLKPKAASVSGSGKASPTRDRGDDNSTTRVALRTEEEQQAAAREREEREREALEKEVKAHREARRKSLANRRVSFAAEATLHTFHEIDYLQESTTSTDATARRASSLAGLPQAPLPADLGFDVPAQQAEELQVTRTSSKDPVSALNESVADDWDDAGDEVEEDDGDELEDVDSNSEEDSEAGDSDDGDGATMVTVDADEMTSASVMSMLSSMSMPDATSVLESTTDVDEALELATQHADEQADASRSRRPLEDGEEAIPAFIGWGKKARDNVRPPIQKSGPQERSPQSSKEDDTALSMEMDVDMDMDTMRPMGGIIDPGQGQNDDRISLDVSRAYNGIVLAPTNTDDESIVSSPMLMPDDSDAEDEPMELTMGVGAIRSAYEAADTSDGDDGLEDMSMEMTTVLGGVLGRQSFGANKARRLSRRQSMRHSDDENDESPMDITVAVGEILKRGSPAREKEDNDESDGDANEATMTMAMDITTALGGICKPASPTINPALALPMPSEADEASAKSPLSNRATTSPKKSAVGASLGLSAFTGNDIHRTPDRSREMSTRYNTRASSASPKKPVLAAAQPGKSPLKIGMKSTTPQREPPVCFIGSRSKSPVRKPVLAARSAAPKSPPKASVPSLSKSLFAKTPISDTTTPPATLTPQARRRQSAFVGAGPASPRITEIFSRRSSLLDAASDFVTGSAQKDRAAVSFDEVPRHSTPEDGAVGAAAMDDREATQNLKELIHNLSPQKKPFKGRKSLHVGSAKGLLGKRPLELDDDDDLDDVDLESQNLVKRFKGPEPSPVKNVRLQQPPSMMETIGRSSRSQRSPSATPLPFEKSQQSAAPRQSAEKETDMFDSLSRGDKDDSINKAGNPVTVNSDDGGERIHLQDFLKLANIQFMELDTTKRRATEGPGALQKSKGGESSRLSTDEDGKPKDPATESLVTTVCKVPLLELYQHACRELKNYIEEGRSIMREIETETYEDNPPIFSEYTTAKPELRVQMDNQFMNIKIFARQQSKKQWYEWRTKLHEGLQEGMRKVLRDLEKDKEILHQRREKVDAIYPTLLSEYKALERECSRLEAFAAQLGGDDQEALIAAQVQKSQLKASIKEHEDETARLEASVRASKARVSDMKKEREQYLIELEQAKRVQEERRSWSPQEILSLKSQVDALEKKSGWAVTGAQGTTLSMAYQREIELVFDVAAFRPGRHGNARIDLWYIGHTRTRDPQPCTPETEFFLQCIRDHVRGLQQTETHPGNLLKVVRASWDTAKQAVNQIRHLSLTFPTTTTKTSDTSIAVVTSILLVPLRTKVEVKLHLRSLGSLDSSAATSTKKAPRGLRIAVSSEARVVYGEPFNAAKMGEFLAARIGKRVPKNCAAKTAATGQGKTRLQTGYYWVDMIEELTSKLLARGRKLGTKE
ncbi:hypothetical protein SEPCBS119000_004722 [Sporothrix epigloea]|uniref:Spc7 kinetochore protein domain-containing protein n=1 Tax=Sporothrix epigloea TaxID=1892477 RepID=A0ABP0DTQ4_9PEZI